MGKSLNFQSNISQLCFVIKMSLYVSCDMYTSDVQGLGMCFL